MSFLPITQKDLQERSIDQLDFIYISGDAYVDHPSFGHAIITRLLESMGFTIGIIPQPNWKNKDDFLKLGIPKIAVLISSGVIDSMVNHYTSSKKKRNDDLYSPGGKSGYRPDRAVIVYSNKVREYMGDIPIIVGGIEASLRRFAHYDYWDDKVRNSLIIDSNSNLLCYGMGERTFIEIGNLIKKGVPITKIKNIRGTVYSSSIDDLDDKIKNFIKSGNKTSDEYILLDSFERVKESKLDYAKCFYTQYTEQDSMSGKTLIQKHGNLYVVQNPPQHPLDTKTMDRIYSLPYEREYHPSYEKMGGIPAITEVKFSVVSQRGCFGGCSFCALTFHQGRVIQNRSHSSIVNEVKNLTWLSDFKGYIHDVGGPTANFRIKSCTKQEKSGVCKNKQCLHPNPCKNLNVDHKDYIELLRKIRNVDNVKKVFIRSGLRYDYIMEDKSDEFIKELCKYHISGQLKVAPEHVDPKVLDLMGKPNHQVYEGFVKKYNKMNAELNMNQFLVPYLISSHPGSTLNSAIKLAEYLRDIKYSPQQVQDFYPTPGTLSTCMFYTELDPRNLKAVYVPKTSQEKSMQRALMQYRKKENYHLVLKGLKEANREDLIGFDPKCLIKPTKEEIIRRKSSLNSRGKLKNGFKHIDDKKHKNVMNKNKNSVNKKIRNIKKK